ncbi:unnamed protein product [Arctia plantaginis]|uniref:PBZ-type domain-containing protein n=1 Tax=Arctia plantaginis TaxID=874455 RepID=A0A8S0Z9F7_ARCPL|nr:unnamed protein product [Arctia plantaginis]
MSDDWQEYINDARTVCKYGTKCYQKNAEHHKQFKHPPVKRKEANRNKRRYSPYARTKQPHLPGPANAEEEKEVKIETESSSKAEHQNTEIKGDKDKEVPIILNLPEDLSFYDKDTDKSIFKELFLINMPDDFFNFFEFINNLGKSAEESMASVNLELIGPFDLLLGKLPILEDKELYLIHWRFFYDPPEFQAVLKKKRSEYHIGYFRDTPEQDTAFVASNDSAKDCHITVMSKNIFGAVYQYLQNEKKYSPFTAAPCQKLMDKIKSYAEENNISLEQFSMKDRLKQIVTKSFHGAGIAVPYNKQTQLGYRRLAETDASLKKLFTSLENATSQEEKDKVFSDLQVVITNASIAVDECDFGTGLELGIDLFCSGLKELHSIALSNLTAAYTVLSRQQFAQIAQTHLKYRRKGPKMSLISSQK